MCYAWPDIHFILPFCRHKFVMDSGIKGFVLDSRGYPVKGAVISVSEGKNITTTVDGEYWRVLLPGTYGVCLFMKFHNGIYRETLSVKIAAEIFA